MLGAIGGFAFGKRVSTSGKEKASEAKDVPIAPPPVPPTETQATSSGWQKWAPVTYGAGAAILAGAAIGTAYYSRDHVTFGWTWATDHMKYVQNLWDEKAMKDRVEDLIRSGEALGVVFKT
jgi:hypothetical protein